MKEISEEFLLGYINAADGEKDPRNLMIIFTTVPTLTEVVSLNNFAEDLFEVVAAYFPIDFIPVSAIYSVNIDINLN